MQLNRWLFTIIVPFLLAFKGSTQKAIFYVSPSGSDRSTGTTPVQAFHTLQKAKAKVREHRSLHPRDTIYVYLLEGEYQISEPIHFDHEDGGAEWAPVVYSAYNPHKAVINGGKRISVWKRYKTNIWVADLPEVKEGKWFFTELYVNGKPRSRASLPKQGFYKVEGFPDGGLEAGYNTKSKRFQYRQGDINASWKNLNDVEIVVYHFWTDTHLKIDSVDEQKNIVSFQRPSGKVFTDDFNNKGARYRVENVWEGMKDPGDWYLDKQHGKLYYIPYPNEDLQQAEVIAPFTPAFLSLKGDAKTGKWITGLHFKNITFQYANVQLPANSTNDGQASVDVNAVIILQGVQQSSFQNCTIQKVGGYAFDVLEGSAYNRFINNKLIDLGGGGIRMTGGAYGSFPALQTQNNIISDNEISQYGLRFASAVGVLLMHTGNNEVLHNHIHHGYYTGISVGWEWGYQNSISRNNLIAYNYIHHIGQGLLSDMGGIYTLGVSPRTVLRNNVIHDVDAHNYGGWGIYNDEGSSYILVEKNIVYNTKFAPYNIHYAKEITVRNNIFALGNLQQLNRTRVEAHSSVSLKRNIIYWKSGILFDGNWSHVPSENANKIQSGSSKLRATYQIDSNLYFNPQASINQLKFYNAGWTEWQGRGNDQHSLYADPKFVNAIQYNFSLRKESPAIQLGFEPIDVSNVGPRKK